MATDPSVSLPSILLVDDDPEAIFLVRRQLQKSGAQNPILTFGNGIEAVEFLKRLCAPDSAGPAGEAKPTLMLLDIKMPAMNGFDVLTWTRAQPQLQNLRTVMLSSSDAPEDKERAQRLGAIGYLLKYPSAKELTAYL